MDIGGIVNWSQLPLALSVTALGLMTALLTGRTVKYILYLLLRKVSGSTDTPVDDRIVEKVRQDWNVEPDDTDTTSK